MTVTYGRPGVTVTEVVAPRETGTLSGTGPSRAVLLADLDRGPVVPTTVSSWSEFRSVFGDWGDNAPRTYFGHKKNASVDAAFLYFANTPSGGSPLTVLRVVNVDAKAATGEIIDNSGDTVLFVDALTPGKIGDRYRVSLTGNWGVLGAFNPADFSDHDFNTPAAYGDGNAVLTVELLNRQGKWEAMERFPGLSVDPDNRNFVDTVVNGESKLVHVEMGSGSLLSLDEREALLAGGSDGSTPRDLTDVLGVLDYLDGGLTISYAGHWEPTDLGLVSAYCKARGDSFHVIDTPDFRTDVSAVANWVSGLNTKNSFSAAYYPPVIINDPAAGVANASRITGCGGAVLGAYMANDSNYGIWKTPAGVSAVIRGGVGPAYRFTNPQLDTLNTITYPVNPIRVVQGVGMCIMGGRTLDQTHADRYVGVRRSFSYLRSQLSALTEFAVFEVNGPSLWREITVRLSTFLGLYFQQGALRGGRENEAFYVKCDESNNTRTSIAAGEVHVEVGVAIEYPAEFVVIKLTHNQSSVRVD